MVYNLSFSHFLYIFNGKMPNFVSKIVSKIPKTKKILLISNFQGNPNFLQKFLSHSVLSKCTYSRQSSMCVTGSYSKIQINPSVFFMLFTCVFRQAPSRIQPGTRQLPPPRIWIQCSSDNRAMSIIQYDISHQVASRYTLF